MYRVDLVLCSHSGRTGKGMKAEDTWAPSPFYLHPETRFAGTATRSGSRILRAATNCRPRSPRQAGEPLVVSWSYAVLPIPPLPQNHAGRGLWATAD